MKHAILTALAIFTIGCQQPTLSVGGLHPPDIDTSVACACEAGRCTVSPASSVASGRPGVAFGEADLCQVWVTIQRPTREQAARDLCASPLVPREVRERLRDCEASMMRLFEMNERIGVGGADAQ